MPRQFDNHLLQDDPDFHPGPVTDVYGDVGMMIHRSYDPERDGWRQHMLQPHEYPGLKMAEDMLNMADEINQLRREVWRLQQVEVKYNELIFGRRDDA